MSGAQVHLQAKSIFTEDPQYTLFSVKYEERDVYVAESFEVPFDNQNPTFGDTVTCTIPPKSDLIRRLTVRSELPQLYNPIGPGYVYPKYSDQVDGQVYVLNSIVGIQPGDFVGYFNTQNLNFWATNFVGYSNLSVAYDSTLTKFVFTSPTYSNISFLNENSASFWGFDIRTFDYKTPNGYYGYNFKNGTLTAPLNLVQAGWILGFTPPPPSGFSYKDSVACRLIKEARLLIGGQTIDLLTSERLVIEDDLGVSYDNRPSLTVLEGKNDTSGVYVPREYYTRLTFNTEAINMSELYRQDVQVQIEFEKFENLPSSLITTNGITDPASFLNVQWATLSGAQVMPNGRLYGTFVWKQYVVRMNVIGNSDHVEFIFYDTTKDINTASSWYTWTDHYNYGYQPAGYITPAYVINGNIYFSWNAQIVSHSLNGMIQNTEPVTPSISPTILGGLYGYGGNGSSLQVDVSGSLANIISDARYLYILYNANMLTFNSNSCTVWNVYPYNDPASSANVQAVFKVYNIATPQLTATTNTAIQNYCLAQTPTYGGITKTFNWISQVKTDSNIFATANVSYTVAGTPTVVRVDRSIGSPTRLWVRYDSTKPLTALSSFDYLSWPGTGAPYSWYDIIGQFNGAYNTLTPSSDGRYIYTNQPAQLMKVDTQNFLSLSSYTYGNPPFTVYAQFEGPPLISDGLYLYFISISDGTSFTFSRYDGTKLISDSSAYQSITWNTTVFPYGYSITPNSFDGRNIYYVGDSDINSNIGIAIVRIDSVTFTLKDWVILNYRSTTGRTSNGPITGTPLVPTSSDYRTPSYSASGIRMVVGTRYLYIGEHRFDYQTATDFLQLDPLTMTSSLTSSMLVKYEKYTQPPKTPVTLYGQTYMNEFTLHANRIFETFTLRFINPVREVWIATDVALSRIILRLNNEVIVDDDQVTTKTIRSFESHTSMPTTNVYVISVSVSPELLSEPSGVVNASRIASQVLEVYPVSVQASDTPLKVYAKVYNVFETSSGTGGLLFNSAY